MVLKCKERHLEKRKEAAKENILNRYTGMTKDAYNREKYDPDTRGMSILPKEDQKINRILLSLLDALDSGDMSEALNQIKCFNYYGIAPCLQREIKAAEDYIKEEKSLYQVDILLEGVKNVFLLSKEECEELNKLNLHLHSKESMSIAKNGMVNIFLISRIQRISIEERYYKENPLSYTRFYE